MTTTAPISELGRQQAAIPDDLLRTKLAPPRLDRAFVSRASLLARIDDGLTRKVTLISAPAGFGKTTLLAEWLSRNDERRTMNDEGPEVTPHRSSFILHRFNVAWISLDAGDNDPVRFWRYVLSACRAWDPTLGKQSLAALRMAQRPSPETVLTPFINELAQLSGQYILVLEDYHSITAPEVHTAVTFLLEHLPSTTHVIITARSEPALPLARLRARDELTELTAEDLRFSRAEMQAFLERTLHISLPPEALGQLEQRTEGWVAGLRLIALTLQHRTESPAVEQLLATFTGGHRHVIDYLVSEVLALQPADVQLFLLSTSFLTRLSGSLCDAVTGRSDSALVLERLELANLFTVPLGSSNRQRWYRYYALFAEAMRQYARQRLSETDIALLHERASKWYEAHGELDDAVDEAIAAGQPVRAATLIESFFDRGGYNELYTLRRWVEQLPDDVLHEHPLICLAYAKAILFTSDRYAPATAVLVERWAQLAEQTWRREQNAPRLGQVAALRALVAFWQGDVPGSFAYARQALELLAEDDITSRSVSLLLVGQEELLSGRIAAAQRFAIEAHTLYEVDGNMDGTLAATALLAELYNQQGEFEQAAQYYQRILDEAIGGEQMLDDQGDALCGLSALAYEHDDLEAAEQQAMRAIDLAKQRHYEALQVQATLILSRVQYARGQTVHAWHELQSLAVQTRKPSLLREIQSWQARLALAMGDLEFVQRWQTGITAQRQPAARLQQEREALIGARLQLAQGNPPAALEMLEGWRAEASAQGRIRSEIEILIVQALAHLAHADRAPAERALIRALLLGQPRGYRRIFLDEGEPLATLLGAIAPNLNQRPLATYAASLLRTLTPSSATATRVAGLPLLEPLSQQELRVLRLIVAGQSNVEIARELVVSTNTIKTHVKNIYRKLNVSTREEARDAARELKLR